MVSGIWNSMRKFTHLIGDRLEWINGMPLAEVTMAAYYNLGFRTYSSAISNYIPHISAKYFEALEAVTRRCMNCAKMSSSRFTASGNVRRAMLYRLSKRA